MEKDVAFAAAASIEAIFRHPVGNSAFLEKPDSDTFWLVTQDGDLEIRPRLVGETA